MVKGGRVKQVKGDELIIGVVDPTFLASEDFRKIFGKLAPHFQLAISYRLLYNLSPKLRAFFGRPKEVRNFLGKKT